MQTETELTLYQISAGLKEIEIELEKSGGEITPDQELIMKNLGELLTGKVDGVVGWVKSKEDLIEAINNRMIDLSNLKAKVTKKLDNFNGYVVSSMDVMDKVKLFGQFNEISIRKPAIIVEILDEDKIPMDYISTQTKVLTKIDKAAIKKALKAELIVEGAVLKTGNRKATFR